MLPISIAPGLLISFMVALALIPLAIIWLDDRRSDSVADRVSQLRDAVKLREHLVRRAAAEDLRQSEVALPRL